MYPHQLLMEDNNLQLSDLSKETQAYIKDFNNFEKGVKLKESRAVKSGKDFEVSEKDQQKLLRLSKSVCIQMDTEIRDKREQERVEEEKQRKEAEALAQQRADEEEKIRLEQELAEKLESERKQQIQEQEVAKKQQEEQDSEPSVGFFF